MRCKALKQLWLLMATSVVVGLAVTLPTITPLAPPKLTACNDEILDPQLCIEQKRTTTYCCINNQQWECVNVRWWVHKNTGTDYFRTDKETECDNLGLVCSPYTGKCQ